MTDRVPTLAAAALFAMGVASFANVASAMPITDALAIKNAAPTGVETVQWGWGLGAGLLGGVIIGGALAAPYYGYAPRRYYPYAYGPPPGYYGPGRYYGPGPYYGPSPYYGPGRW